MKLEKELKIYNKVFTDSDIRTLWNFVVKQTATSLSGTANIIVKNNGENVLYDDESVFESTSYTHKDISQIEIEYYSKDYKSRIYINIRASNVLYDYGDSCVKISGTEEDWVIANFSQLHDIIECVSDTPWLVKFYRKWWEIINYVLAVVYPSFFFFCLMPLIRSLTFALYIKISIAVFYIILCIIVVSKLIGLVRSLPLLVIDVNGKYRAKIYNRSKIAWYIIGSILVPVITEVILKFLLKF